MRANVRLLGVAAGIAAIAVLLFAALAVLALPAEQRAPVVDVLRGRGVALVLVALLALAAAAFAGMQWLRGEVEFIPALTHLLDRLHGGRAELRVDDASGVPAPLADAVNRLAADYAERRRAGAAEIAAATDKLAEERDLLAAVLSDLPAAAIACSRDGRILLYTPRAVAMIRAVEPEVFIGLGRTIFALFRRSAIVHALERLDAAVARDEARAGATALLATRGGALLHARFTPLQGRAVNGFFLHLQTLESREEPVPGDADGRRRIANLRAAVEMLRDYPEMSAQERRRFVEVIDQESATLAGAVDVGGGDERWPLEDVTVETLLSLLQSAMSAAVGAAVALPASLPPLWIAAESFALTALLRDYCSQLPAGERQYRLDVGEDGRYLRLMLRWSPPQLLDPARWRDWEQAPLSVQGFRLPLSPAAIARGHGGELWQRIDGDEATLCILLPRTELPDDDAARAGVAVPAPQMFDFSTQSLRLSQAGADPPLRNLIYTVFDTETTGLQPSAGDQIISLGGIRVVGGRILSREVFESLVASTRRIDPAAQKVHGIDAAMLAGQPDIAEVLPRFGQFCEDTVLVAHNAAFDLRFLEMQAEATGIRLDQPVLDTLLLSQVVYPVEQGHALELLAERLGVSVLGRHTALGDAIVTAEIFLRLLPLLEARGIHTLQAALEASRAVPLAKVRY